MPKQILRFVDIEDIELQVVTFDSDTIEELYRFGTLMVSEVQQRASHLDSKLTGVLGWAAATLAFLLLRDLTGLQIVGRIITFLAIAFAASSVILTFLGLKTAMWSFPSERDWFKEGLLEAPGTLKRYHIVSMLNAHQQQHQTNSQKANRLRLAEIFLALSSSMIAVALLSKLF